MIILPVMKYRHRKKKTNFLKNIETTLTIKLQSQEKYLAHLIVSSPSHLLWPPVQRLVVGKEPEV